MVYSVLMIKRSDTIELKPFFSALEKGKPNLFGEILLMSNDKVESTTLY